MPSTSHFENNALTCSGNNPNPKCATLRFGQLCCCVGNQRCNIQRRMSTDPPCAGESSIQTIVCTPATSAALKKLQKRKKKPKLNFYRSATLVPPSRQHIQYDVHKDGTIGYTLKHLRPPKNAKATIKNLTHTAPTLHDVPFSIPEPFDDLPPEVSLDFLGEESRNRGAGVCTLHYSLTFSLPCLPWLFRIILCWCGWSTEEYSFVNSSVSKGDVAKPALSLAWNVIVPARSTGVKTA